MNEIEKMYENANIEKHLAYFECHRGRSFKRCCPINPEEKDKECTVCVYGDEMKEVYEYPPFTAEKQLEITKFIGLHYGFQMLKNEAFDYIIATKIFVKYELEYKGYGYGYDEAIANLVNNLWRDLTEKERQQIKEILDE